MTELETRLTDALAALSKQWEADQDQHVEELESLRVRIEDLVQLVTDFAAQHEKQAAAWQAQLQQLDTQVGTLTKQYAHISRDYKALADLLEKE